MTVAIERNSSRYIPWMFVGGFAIVIAVNAVMIWLAVVTASTTAGRTSGVALGAGAPSPTSGRQASGTS